MLNVFFALDYLKLAYLDDGSDELLQEVMAQQRRPVMVDEVDEQTFDVGAILILSDTKTAQVNDLIRE